MADLSNFFLAEELAVDFFNAIFHSNDLVLDYISGVLLFGSVPKQLDEVFGKYLGTLWVFQVARLDQTTQTSDGTFTDVIIGGKVDQRDDQFHGILHILGEVHTHLINDHGKGVDGNIGFISVIRLVAHTLISAFLGDEDLVQKSKDGGKNLVEMRLESISHNKAKTLPS